MWLCIVSLRIQSSNNRSNYDFTQINDFHHIIFRHNDQESHKNDRYKENKWTFGESIVLRIMDLNSSTFFIHYLTLLKQNQNIHHIYTRETTFTEVLLHLNHEFIILLLFSHTYAHVHCYLGFSHELYSVFKCWTNNS